MSRTPWDVLEELAVEVERDNEAGLGATSVSLELVAYGLELRCRKLSERGVVRAHRLIVWRELRQLEDLHGYLGMRVLELRKALADVR